MLATYNDPMHFSGILRIRFGLRTFLILVTLVTVVCGRRAVRIHSARQRDWIVECIRSRNGEVAFDYDVRRPRCRFDAWTTGTQLA